MYITNLTACTGYRIQTGDLLVDGLKEFALVVTYFGPVHLLDQLGVFVDEPSLP